MVRPVNTETFGCVTSLWEYTADILASGLAGLGSVSYRPAYNINLILWHWLQYRQDSTVVLELQYR